MKIFVTGASGFIGGVAAKRLKEAGHEVVAMSRSERSDDKIRALGVEPVRCSLGEVSSGDLNGCDAIVHCAAWVEPWGTYKQYHDANVVGTEQLLAVAREAGVRRFIHIGTEAALFYGQHMRNIDEDCPYATSSPFYYSKTKALAEIAVIEANDPAAGFESVSVRPRLVWGPGDQTVLPETLAMIEKGAFAWVNGGKSKTSTTHVENLVHCVQLALDKGKGGEAYFVTDDEIVTFREFLTRLVATQGVEIPEKSVPGLLLRGIAWVLENLWRLVGAKKAPPITRFAAAIVSRDCTICIDKAKKELGYQTVISIEDGLADLPRRQQC